MKKKTHLLVASLVLAGITGEVVLPMGTLVPQIVQAVEESNIQTTIPEQTKVVITKLVGTSFTGEVPNKDGDEITDFSKLGTNVKPLKGVVFTAFKLPENVSSENLAKLKATKTVEQLKTVAAELGVALSDEQDLTATNEAGKAEWTVAQAKNGTYIVAEKSAPETVSSALAVPFVIAFPMSASNGTGYLKSVNVYPKNIEGHTPTPGKDVGALGNDTGSYNIGAEIPFILKGSIPTNIQDYETYELIDEFDTKLTPIKEGITVQYGTKPLTETEDYTVTWEGQKVRVALTAKGLEKIAANVELSKRDLAVVDGENETEANTDDAPFIQVNLKAKINSTAILSEGISNKTRIEYDNKKDGNKTVKPVESEETKVYTGGKRFVKVDANDANKKLEGAEFELLDAGKYPVLWTQELIDANLATTTNAAQFAGTVAIGQPIQLKSNEQGEFAIAGLAYGKESTKYKNGAVVLKEGKVEDRTYYIREIKAPEDYVLPVGEIEFSVGQSSATGVATSIAGDQQQVNNNKRPLIPNTGGIGSVVFVLAGLATMGFAAIGLRNKKEN